MQCLKSHTVLNSNPMTSQLVPSTTNITQSAVAQVKAIQWIQRPSEARIGRILSKFKDNLPPSPPSGWNESWSAVFEDRFGISEWPVKQFHECEFLEFDKDAYILKNFLPPEVQVLLVESYRRTKVRLSPSDKTDKSSFGAANLGWRKLAKGYGEPKIELPDFIYDLTQLAIKFVILPALNSKQKSSALIQYLDCYGNPSVEIPLHSELTEESALFESGQPLVIFTLGCQADFYWRNSETKHLIESGDCIVFGKKSRLMKFGVKNVQPSTEPEYLSTLDKPLMGQTLLTVRQVKA